MNSSGGAGGAAGGGSGSASSSGGGSSSNKTPSPTESNKWTLSRFFPKPANQTSSSENVSPGNVSMKVPGILPGGAQIIPESIEVTTAIVKNEKMLVDDPMDMEEGEEEDDDDEEQQLRYGAGLSVTPVALKVKKEAIDGMDTEMALGASAIPKTKSSASPRSLR